METQFIKCKKCKSKLRVPKGRGLLDVTCPVCKYTFEFDSKIEQNVVHKTPFVTLYTKKYVKTNSATQQDKAPLDLSEMFDSFFKAGTPKPKNSATQSTTPKNSRIHNKTGDDNPTHSVITNINKLSGVKKAISSARKIKNILLDFGEKMKLLDKHPNSAIIIDIYPIPELKDCEFYLAPYIYISLKLRDFSDENIFEGVSTAFAMAYFADKEKIFTDPQTISMADTIGPIFNTTSAEFAQRFVPYINSEPNDSYVKTLFKVFCRYKTINVEYPGYYDFMIRLPDGLYTVNLPDGRKAVTKENLEKFIKMI